MVCKYSKLLSNYFSQELSRFKFLPDMSVFSPPSPTWGVIVTVSTVRYVKNDVIVLLLSISTIKNEAKQVLKCLKAIPFLYY